MSALIDSPGLQREYGLSRRAVDAVMRQLPVLTPTGFHRRYVRRSDVEALFQPPVVAGEKVSDTGTVHRVRRCGVSPSVYIVPRKVKSGRRWHVRYRVGGRDTPPVHAGSFKKHSLAKARRDFVVGELAAGRDPADALRREQAPRRSFREWADLYKASRVDVAAKTRETTETALKRLLPFFGSHDPLELTPAEVRAWIAASTDLAPSSVKLYLNTLRQVLDFAGAEPNPARDKTVKLPRQAKLEIAPPESAYVLAVLERVTKPMALALATLEQTGMRVGEAERLTWGDVDVPGQRFRLPRSSTKTGRSRWVQVPEWLMEVIGDRVPVEDRVPDRRVFLGFKQESARDAMRRACKLAEIPSFSPHDLRHRRISLWHGQGIPEKELSVRVGHSKPTLTLDLYSHVMPLDELPVERVKELIA